MVEIDITRMSSKGQIVIPANLRQGIQEGDKLLIIRSQNQIIIKKASDLDETFKEDLEFAQRTEEAYKRHERGEFKSMPADKFLEELDKW